MGLFAEPYCEYSTGRHLTIFDKDHDTVEEGQLRIALSSLEAPSPLKARFLQLSIGVRYNYYVQLVAIKRNWMRVANLNFARGGGEAGHAHSCSEAVCLAAKTLLL